MTTVNEQEIRRRLKIFASVELARASQDLIQKSAGCPPLYHVPSAAIHGWPPEVRDHVSGGCMRCRRRTAQQWNITQPPIGSLVRHLVDQTLPDDQQILRYVEDVGQASRILTIIHFLAPLFEKAREVAHYVASSRPALTLAGGAVFAPANEERNTVPEVHYVHSGLRWTAPAEAGKQYVYVEATSPVSVLALIGNSPHASRSAGPLFQRIELQILPLRGTQFTFRASSCLGEVSELISTYGKDYEVIVVVTDDK